MKDHEKQIQMTRRVTRIIEKENDKMYDTILKERVSPSRRVLRRVVAAICLVVLGTLGLTVLIHYECTKYSKFKIFDQVYECKWVGTGELK